MRELFSSMTCALSKLLGSILGISTQNLLYQYMRTTTREGRE